MLDEWSHSIQTLLKKKKKKTSLDVKTAASCIYWTEGGMITNLCRRVGRKRL